jgi:hypothetical protein
VDPVALLCYTRQFSTQTLSRVRHSAAKRRVLSLFILSKVLFFIITKLSIDILYSVQQ